ncbi:MAG TPA: V-type ATP synthase subunit D [Planctomycetota bacterium]|jgi:V/A-type H+-transporting ATPase subunit D|nr:V-type ATP synthase subunit D [Planctomycetota bacterium]OQC21716.1 MAG: V-type ATP synthase subunit D [Planctomycetes bacterium ADurb.Bin069]HNR98904.1 V-type ATP synthase subunit D [Planctomycetota bacterium]HNU26021.1 V-type ATP synthase subunit D [Planctomycetota bacterium]HOE29686.1 V-type ATP synthase subunit D [Planctomycetota bacterium]
MAQRKFKFTRPELKRQRDALARFSRYLPMLKLKQQQLQLTLREVERARDAAAEALAEARARFERHRGVRADTAGVDIEGLSACAEVRTDTRAVAGVKMPVFEGVRFPEARYSLFGTPPWVDAAIADLRAVNERRAAAEVIDAQHRLLRREFVKILQRVNLFEKIKIPEAREAIRAIRIHLGDELTAAVGRAKAAKSLCAEAETASTAGAAGSGEAAP